MTKLNEIDEDNRPECAKALHEIYKKNGLLTPELVVKAAATKTSPLHPFFEWDNTRAAAEWRLYQAAHLIRRIKVRVVCQDIVKSKIKTIVINPKPGQKTEPVRLYHNVTPGEPKRDHGTGGVYIELPTILKDRNYRQQMLAQAARDLRAFQNKYRLLGELAGVFEAAKKFFDTIE